MLNVTERKNHIPSIPIEKDPVEHLPHKVERNAPPLLENMQLMLSVPIYWKEWQRGNVQSFLLRILKQKLSAGQAIEVNFILNDLGKIATETESIEHQDNIYKMHAVTKVQWGEQTFYDGERYPGRYTCFHYHREMILFFRDLVEFQKLLHTAPSKNLGEKITQFFQNRRNRKELKKIREKYAQDPAIIEIFHLLEKSAQKIQISYEDCLPLDLEEEYGSKGIDAIRTLGLDYFRDRTKTLENKERKILHLFDVDTYPTETYFQELIDWYTQNPEVLGTTTLLAYFPGDLSSNNLMVTPRVMLEKTNTYNRVSAGSPQISVTGQLAAQLGTIQPINRGGWEDVGTTYRIQAAQLQRSTASFEQSHRYPTTNIVITALRSDGFVDGSAFLGDISRIKANDDYARRHYDTSQEPISVRQALKEEELENWIATLQQERPDINPEDVRKSFFEARASIYQALLKEQQLQRNIMKVYLQHQVGAKTIDTTSPAYLEMVSRVLFKSCELGDRDAGLPTEQAIYTGYDEEEKKYYLTDNGVILCYYLGIIPEWPRDIQQPLNLFHSALREIYGEPMTIEEATAVSDLQLPEVQNQSTNKTFLWLRIAATMAFGRITQTYLTSESDVAYKYPVVEYLKPYEERSKVLE